MMILPYWGVINRPGFERLRTAICKRQVDAVFCERGFSCQLAATGTGAY
jgi:hypothetical protein